MENAKWFYMSLFELLQKKEEARSEEMFGIVKANKLLQINLFRQSDEHEVLIMQNSGDKMNEITQEELIISDNQLNDSFEMLVTTMRDKDQ